MRHMCESTRWCCAIPASSTSSMVAPSRYRATSLARPPWGCHCLRSETPTGSCYQPLRPWRLQWQPLRNSRLRGVNVAQSYFRRIAASAIILAAVPSFAQGVLEEVVVSAQKREQNLQDVGISMSAFTGDQLKALGVQESFDVAAFTPGVHISGNLAGQNTQFTIRGVTQNDFNDIVEAPNAVYLDEGYIAVAQAQTFGVYDIDRVEVLKGPQGTLFGRNATGGLVHYISRKPNFEKIAGFTDVTFGNFDSGTHGLSERVEAAVTGPFSQTVAGRIAMLYNHSDAYLKNLYPYGAPAGLAGLSPGNGAGADLGGDETYALRGTLDFKPTEIGRASC